MTHSLTPGKPGRKSNPDQVLKRRSVIWGLYADKGLNQNQIAEAIGITQQQVSQDLRQSRKYMRAGIAQQHDEWLGRELAICDHEESLAIERRDIALKAWKKSGGTIRIKTVKGSATTEGKVAGQEVRLREQEVVGDPRLLKAAEDASARIGYWHERRCKLLGLDAPIKVSHAIMPVETMSDMDLEATVLNMSTQLKALPAHTNGNGNGNGNGHGGGNGFRVN